jgi:5-methylcytosine-specific restriction endonuclease McrA
MDLHTQRQWEGKFFRCQMACWYCRVPLVLSEATKDHLTPISRGGSDSISNIVPACIDCNRLKGELTEDEFREQRKHLFTVRGNSTASAFAESHFVAKRTIDSEDNQLLRILEKERENVIWWKR